MATNAPGRQSATGGPLTSVVTSCILFVALNAGLVALCVSGALTTRTYQPLADIENTYRFLMAGELFFIIFLWPLIASPGGVSMPGLGALLAVSIPLVVIAAFVANVPTSSIIFTHLLLAAVGAATISGVRLVEAGRPGWWRGYLLAATALGGGLPLFNFLVMDLTGSSVRWLGSISPFWAMEIARDAGPESRALWAASVFFFGVVAAVAGHIGKRAQRRGEGT